MIEFFFDCSSPWTYLAFHNIQPLAAEFGARSRWRPILVGGIFNTVNPSVYEGRAHPVPAEGALFGQGPAGLGAARRPEDQDAAQRVPGEQRQGHARLHRAGAQASWCRRDAPRSRPTGATTRTSRKMRCCANLRAASASTPRRSSPAIGDQAIKDELRANTDEVMAPRRLRLADHLRRRDDMYFGNDRLPLSARRCSGGKSGRPYAEDHRLPRTRPAREFRLEQIPSVPLKPGEVRVAVRAAGINFPDILMAAGQYQLKAAAAVHARRGGGGRRCRGGCRSEGRCGRRADDC